MNEGKLRIGIVLRSLNAGGVQTVVLRLARYFRSQGHCPELVLIDKPGVWYDEVADNMPVCCLPADRSFSRYTHAKRIGELFAARKYDVILLNHVQLAQAALSYAPDETLIIPVVLSDSAFVYQVACSNPDQV